MHVYVACLFCLQNLELIAHTSLYVCKTNLHLDDVLPVPEKKKKTDSMHKSFLKVGTTHVGEEDKIVQLTRHLHFFVTNVKA